MTQPEWDELERTVGQMTRPEQLQLIERIARSLRAEDGDPSNQQGALCRLRAEIMSLPVFNPDDGWSNREHDQALYGRDSN